MVSEGIGSFKTVFEVMIRISVITNAGLLVFSSGLAVVKALSPSQKVWLFVVYQYALFAAQYVIALLVDGEVYDVTAQRQRGHFFRSVVTHNALRSRRRRPRLAHHRSSEQHRPSKLHRFDDGIYSSRDIAPGRLHKRADGPCPPARHRRRRRPGGDPPAAPPSLGYALSPKAFFGSPAKSSDPRITPAEFTTNLKRPAPPQRGGRPRAAAEGRRPRACRPCRSRPRGAVQRPVLCGWRR